MLEIMYIILAKIVWFVGFTKMFYTGSLNLQIYSHKTNIALSQRCIPRLLSITVILSFMHTVCSKSSLMH